MKYLLKYLDDDDLEMAIVDLITDNLDLFEDEDNYEFDNLTASGKEIIEEFITLIQAVRDLKLQELEDWYEDFNHQNDVAETEKTEDDPPPKDNIPF